MHLSHCRRGKGKQEVIRVLQCMELKSLPVSLINSQFMTLETAHTYLIHFHVSPTVCKQLSCPGCVVPISCSSGHVSTWPSAVSPQPEGNTQEALAVSRPGPESVIDSMGRQSLLPVLEGNSFLCRTWDLRETESQVD